MFFIFACFSSAGGGPYNKNRYLMNTIGPTADLGEHSGHHSYFEECSSEKLSLSPTATGPREQGSYHSNPGRLLIVQPRTCHHLSCSKIHKFKRIFDFFYSFLSHILLFKFPNKNTS
jgi:hypothetical protein